MKRAISNWRGSLVLEGRHFARLIIYFTVGKLPLAHSVSPALEHHSSVEVFSRPESDAPNGRKRILGRIPGAGEYFIRVAAAHDVAALVEYSRVPLQEAVVTVLEKVEALGGTGGLIALDAQGRVAMGCNTRRMYRASIDGRGARSLGIRAGDTDPGNPRGGSTVWR